MEAAVPSLRPPLRKTSCGAGTWLQHHDRPSQPTAQPREAAGTLRQTTALGSPREPPSVAAATAPCPPCSPPAPVRIHLVLQQVFSFRFPHLCLLGEGSGEFKQLLARGWKEAAESGSHLKTKPQSCHGRWGGDGQGQRCESHPCPSAHGDTLGLPGNTGAPARLRGPWWEVLMVLPFCLDFHDLPYPHLPSISAGCNPTQAAQRPRSVL